MPTSPSRTARRGVRVVACRCGTRRYRVRVRKVLRVAASERTGGIRTICTENRNASPIVNSERAARSPALQSAQCRIVVNIVSSAV